MQVGDGIGMDLKLSNHVYNALKRHCYSEQRRSARLHEKKEHSTAVSTSGRLISILLLHDNVEYLPQVTCIEALGPCPHSVFS